MDPERFKQATVEIIAKRAASVCSNPDCAAVTFGPAAAPDASINVGEAAHIFGARSGSSRFRDSMSDAERSDITNAIWLCRNCHKLVDADPVQYPAELLFEWRRAHERAIAERLGKTGTLLREKVTNRLLEELDDCTYLAQQIIIDRPKAWEYRLTAEFLRSWLEPTKFRWQALEKKLYYRPMHRIASDDFVFWYSQQLDNFSHQIDAISNLLNNEIMIAWGPPGVAGSVVDIHRISKLIAEVCQRILDWEEEIRFSHVPSKFEDAKALLVGIAGSQMSQIFDIPSWILSVLADEGASGEHVLALKFELPADWAEKCRRAVERAMKLRSEDRKRGA
jgi:HNH endonuclease